MRYQEGESESISISSFRIYMLGVFHWIYVKGAYLWPWANQLGVSNHQVTSPIIVAITYHKIIMCQVVFSSSFRARSLASVQHLVHASMANGKHAGVSAVDDGPLLPSLLLSFEEEPSPLLFLVLAARIESTHDTNDFCWILHCNSHAVGSTSLAIVMLLLLPSSASFLIGKDHIPLPMHTLEAGRNERMIK